MTRRERENKRIDYYDNEITTRMREPITMSTRLQPASWRKTLHRRPRPGHALVGAHTPTLKPAVESLPEENRLSRNRGNRYRNLQIAMEMKDGEERAQFPVYQHFVLTKTRYRPSLLPSPFIGSWGGKTIIP